MHIVQNKKWWILLSICLMTFMATLDSSIVNIALPVINTDLRIPTNQAEWIISIYLVVICALLLPLGKIADSFGKTNFFEISIVMFTIGSIFCSLSHNIVLLLIGRIIQAVAASLNFATNNGIITQSFSMSDRGKALGILSATAAVGSIAGPSLGGLILSYLPWTYIFWINVPVGILTFIVSLIVLPKETKPARIKIDILGSLTLGMGLILTFLGISIGQQLSFIRLVALIPLLLGLLLLVIFVLIEHGREYALLKLEYLKNTNLAISVFTCFLIYIINFSFNVVSPFYLENTQHLRPSISGIIWMAFPIVQIIVAPIAGYLADKMNQAKLVAIAAIFTLISQIGFTFSGLSTPVLVFAICVGIMGLGNGMFNTPNNAIAMNESNVDELGIVGSLLSFSQNMGMVVGNLSITTVLFHLMSQKSEKQVISYPTGHSNLFVYAMHHIFIYMSVISIIVLLLSTLRYHIQKKAVA